MFRIALITSAAMLTLPAAAAMAQAAPPHAMMPIDGTVLDVVAEGSSTRVPDLAVIGAGVVTQAATASEAMQQNSARMARVLAALRKAGIADRDIQTANLSLAPQYRYEQNQPPILTGYQATNQLSLRFRDVAKSGAILDLLVREGANDLSGPNLTIEKPEAALDEARTAAVATARARAELYAKAAGLRVDRILSISEGGERAPGPIMVQAMRAKPVADTQMVPGERELTINLTVRFLLK